MVVEEIDQGIAISGSKKVRSEDTDCKMVHPAGKGAGGVNRVSFCKHMAYLL